MFKIQPMQDSSLSPSLVQYKNYQKLTPSKLGVPTNLQYTNGSVLNIIGTNRSSVSGSTASQYNSVNATLQKQLDNSTPSYISNKYNQQLPTKPVTNFDALSGVLNTSICNQERGRSQENRDRITYRNTNILDIYQQKNLTPTPSQRIKQINNDCSQSSINEKSIIEGYCAPFLNNHQIPIQPSPLTASIRSKVTNARQTRETEQDLNISRDIGCDQFCCINHPSKKAKYRMPQDQSVSLCSKCAVTMVGQGFRVEEIPEQTASDIRKREIEDFLEKVADQIPNMEKVLYALTTKQEEIRKYYDQQLQKIQFFFNQIGELMEQQRLEMEKNLQINYCTVNQCYDEQLSEMQRQVNEAGNMQKDIELNVNRIIRQIELQPFREIMQSYNQNLQQMVEKLQDVQRQPIDVIKIQIPNIDSQIPKYKNMIQSIAAEIEVQTIKTSLVKKSQQDTQQNDKIQDKVQQHESMFSKASNVQNSLYVSFENKEQFQNNLRGRKSPAPGCKTPDENVNSQNTRISPNTLQSKPPIQSIRVATVQLYEKTNEKQKPFRNLFAEVPESKKKALDHQNTSGSFEEGHSQMIEKEDIENTYNLMLCDNESEQEELQQHIIEMNKSKSQSGGIQLFCSPQFKDH